MTAFNGFPVKARQTPLPNLFFTAVLPQVDDLDELKVTLGFFWKLSWKKGYPRFVSLKEMAGDLDLMSGLARNGADPSARLKHGLELALGRGTILHLGLERPDGMEHLYFLNTPTDKRAIERVQSGEVDLGALPRIEAVPEPPEARNIYGLYEENIGVLTPLIIEELKEAEEQYPYPWIIEAFRVAVEMNRRRWRYIQRVLEHWKAEGRPHGRPTRDTQEAPPVSGPRTERAGPGQGRPETPARRGGYLVKRKPS